MNPVHDNDILEQIFGRKPKPKLTLEERVTKSAEAILAAQPHVSAIEVLIRMGLLSPNLADDWRHGRILYLEDAMQAGRDKVTQSLKLFGEWALSRGLRPVEATYIRPSREGNQELLFTNVKYAGLEAGLRSNYVSQKLTERRKKSVEEKLNKAPERVVFLNRRDSACGECGVDLPSGSFLSMEAGEPLCMACAGFGDLEFLPRGDVALTRRATRYSQTHAVVVEWSRSRKRYERQGILVTEEAIRRAEEECAADAPERARERERAAVARKKEDAAFVQQMKGKIHAMFPGCPAAEVEKIAAHTAFRGSGRVGRSAAGRKLDSDAVTLAVVAAVRHRHTKYDELLARGVARGDARAMVQDAIEQTLESWRWAV